MAGAQVDDPVGDAQREVEQSQKQIADTLKSFNQLNPLTVNGGEASGGTLQGLLAQPGLQKYVKLMGTPQFGEDLSALISHPNRIKCLQAELGWLFFIMILRAWRNSKSKHWTKGIWIYIWTTLLLWVGSIYFIPHYFFGAPFDRLTYEIVTTIRGK